VAFLPDSETSAMSTIDGWESYPENLAMNRPFLAVQNLSQCNVKITDAASQLFVESDDRVSVKAIEFYSNSTGGDFTIRSIAYWTD
jgi:hypothetical protein